MTLAANEVSRPLRPITLAAISGLAKHCSSSSQSGTRSSQPTQMMLGGCASALWNLTPAYGNGFLHPGGARRNEATAKALLRWAAAERETWLDAVPNDPLLPTRILPSDYLGQQAIDLPPKAWAWAEVLWV